MQYALLLRAHRHERVRWCLRLTAAHFDALYPDWVASTFQKRDALASITGLFADIRVLLMRDNRVNRGVVVHTGRLKRSPLKYYGDSEARTKATPPLNLPHRLDGSFLRNLAILMRSRAGRAPMNERAADMLVSGHLGYDGDWFVVTPSYLCGHGVLSLRDDEVGVHYPTVASFILRAVFDDSAAYSPASLANYTGECFSESISFALGKYVAPDAVMPYMGARWAAFYSAFLSRRWAADAQRRRQLTDRERIHLFFRLNCFVGCGDPVIRDLCNDVVYSSEEFSRAMGCKRERKVLCDCDRLGNCQTHVPAE
ncbi:hypothetical protein V5799_018719 [Amblyomma americanum]|uniref:Uncharacterized protein n=2 Tax=Amblyomma americanum TaxID=6943 RepID=A0AAQ4EYZ7_AMBAM